MYESPALSDLWFDSTKKPDGERIRAIYWDIVKAIYGPATPLDILEIGVYKGMLARLLENQVQVKSYTGIDPYIGGRSSSYFGTYWRGQNDADSIYQTTKAFYDSRGYTLCRSLSDAYWRECTKQFDVIIVDGDHTDEIAHWDMHHWFQVLRPNGLMMIDDYNNPDTPEVTKATTRFLNQNAEYFERMGYQRLEFLNPNKVIPIGMNIVYVQKKASAPMAKRLDFKSRLTLYSRTRRLARNYKNALLSIQRRIQGTKK